MGTGAQKWQAGPRQAKQPPAGRLGQPRQQAKRTRRSSCSLQRTGMATAATAGSSSPPTPHADDSPEPPLPGEKVYVAVGREVAESRATLLWALHKFPRGAGAASFVLLHVYSPPKLLPFRTSLALFFRFLFSTANGKVFLFSVHCCKWKGLFFRLQEMIWLTVFSCQSCVCVVASIRVISQFAYLFNSRQNWTSLHDPSI
jgi:hypothetical protein